MLWTPDRLVAHGGAAAVDDGLAAAGRRPHCGHVDPPGELGWRGLVVAAVADSRSALDRGLLVSSDRMGAP